MAAVERKAAAVEWKATTIKRKAAAVKRKAAERVGYVRSRAELESARIAS